MADQGTGQQRPAGWHRDPFGRFHGRYWDGERWTDQVVKENRSLATDPPDGETVPGGGPSVDGTPATAEAALPPATSGRSWRTWQLLTAVGVAFVLGIAAGAGGAEKDQKVAATDTAEPATTRATLSHVQVIPPSSAPAPTPPPTIATTTIATTTTAPGPKTEFGAGTYRVGVDIAPGTYVAPGGTNCYWERQSVFGGELDSIIANDLSRGGQVVTTISASDKGFKTSGCGTWRRG